MGRMTYRERKERRAERREEWAKKRDAKSEESFAQADRIAEGIPMGQPVLVGHHSERGHRRDLDRMDNGMRKGVEHGKMAKRHRQKAEGIRRQLDTSVYDDDHDATERLRERIGRREAQRERIKAVNRIAAKVGRKHGLKKRTGHWLHSQTDDEREALHGVLVEIVKEAEATKKEIRDLSASLQYNGTLGFASYELSNLGATIRRDRKRLQRLEREQAEA